jgi:hypothetical protein
VKYLFAFISEPTIALLWIIWFGSSVLIGLGSIPFFRAYPNVFRKRQFHRWFTISYGAVFFLYDSSEHGRFARAIVIWRRHRRDYVFEHSQHRLL